MVVQHRLHRLNHLGSFLLQNWRLISMFLVPVLLLPVALVSGTVCHYHLAFWDITIFIFCSDTTKTFLLNAENIPLKKYICNH
jgi:hypothetical protein